MNLVFDPHEISEPERGENFTVASTSDLKLYWENLANFHYLKKNDLIFKNASYFEFIFVQKFVSGSAYPSTRRKYSQAPIIRRCDFSLKEWIKKWVK